MISIRRLASALCLAICSLASLSNAQTITATGTLDPTQVYTTPNIVQPTVAGTNSTPWVNGVYQDNLTCWSWGDPGYCGPNAIVRPGNNINFSFGTTDLYQVQAIANVLPNSGTGLRVNGYNFGFTAKNGNGWDNGQTDYFNAYVNFYDSSGKMVRGDWYDLNYKFNWTTFNFSKTFDTPYATSDLGNVQYGFIGRDTNGWAGPYGPEVYGISFSLRYSVDPCFVNVLSSPSCPGYLDELAKLNTTATLTSPTTNTTSTGTQILEPVTQTVLNSPTSSATTASAETPASTSVVSPTTTTVVATTTSSSAPATTASPTANNPQPKVGEVTQSSAPKSTVSTSQILSIISKEQDRLGSLEKSVVEQTTQQANQAASSATQQAEQVASQAQSQSIAASMQAARDAQQTAQNSSKGSDTVTIVAPSVVQNSALLNSQSNSASVGLKAPEFSMPQQESNSGSVSNVNTYRAPVSSASIQNNYGTIQETGVVTYALVPQITLRSQNLDQRSSDNTNGVETQIVSVATPDRRLLESIQNQTNIPSQTNQQPTQKSSVNQKAKDNELAGGVNLAGIAKQPQGFDLYMSAMPDSQFYASREIYRGQRNVDNARLLRGLTGGSDRLHQQMIDQQYTK